MNEQIKSLVEQAKQSVPAGLAPEQWLEVYHAKFAELIVLECAQVCQDQPNHYALKTDRDNCAVAIKEHFGVEE